MKLRSDFLTSFRPAERTQFQFSQQSQSHRTLYASLDQHSAKMKHEIEKFTIKGEIYIWKYLENENNYPGWNISFDRNVSEKLLELLNLMDNCEWSSKKTLQTNFPSQTQLGIANNRSGNAKWKSKSSLVLNLKKDEPTLWKIIEDEKQIEIRFGQKKLIEFRKAVVRKTNNLNDFAIYLDDENCLYFW